MATVNELVTALGFELKPDALKNINKIEVGISHLQDAVGKLGRMLTDGLSMKDYFSNALGRSQDIMNSAKAIGMSTDALQEWQYAAKASGVSAQAVISDIENLRANYFMSEKGLLRLADSFKKMSAGGAYWYGNMYGISKDTVLMLRQGSAALKEFQDEAHRTGAITPPEELEKAAKLNAELEKRKIAIQKIVDTIVLKAAPVIEKILKKFDEWMAADPGRFELVIQGITAALMGLASSQILSGIGAVINLIKSIGIGLVSLTPGGVILGGISAAIYGLYKDFQNFKNGGGNLLPWDDIIKDFEIAADRISELIDGIKDKWNRFKEWLKTEEGQQTKKTVKGYASAIWDAEKELVNGSFQVARKMTEVGGAWIGAALNTKGGFLRPFDMMTNMINAGNLALQDWQLADKYGMGKYFRGNRPSTPSEKKTDAINSNDTQTITDAKQYDLQNIMDYMPGKNLVSEVGLKSSSIRAITEAMTTINNAPQQITNPIVRDANFNGANINIITGASTEELIDVLTSMGGDVSDSYNGTGFIY